MSNLKWLVCSLAFASLVTLATSAFAQDYWNVRSNARCGQTNAYPAAVSHGYRNDVPNYGDFSSRNYYGAQSGYGSVQPYLGQRNPRFQDHRGYSVPYGYDDQQLNWGGSSMSGSAAKTRRRFTILCMVISTRFHKASRTRHRQVICMDIP